MAKKQFKVVIAGLGGRGYHTYAKFAKLYPERMKIVAIADVDPLKVKLCGDEYGVPLENRFTSAEKLFEKERFGDVAVIATQDGQHKDHSIMALKLGYHLLLEKPIAESIEDCLAIEKEAIKYNRLVVVCHVLRYTTFFRKIKEIIDSKEAGEVVNIQAMENVSFWHQAHSFTRGNWRNDHYTTPMIVQKCCHDVDIISYLLDKKCLSVQSFGSLYYFKKENAPEGSALRCKDCKVKDCPYNAYNIYLKNKEIGFELGNDGWPIDILCEQPTKEKIIKALDEGPYGRCVFHCDNNVVDHQITNLLFEDGRTASLTMTGFTEKNYRMYKVNCTKGEIEANQDLNIVTFTPFGKEPVVYDINKLATDLTGHGGGDNKMLEEMFDMLEGSLENVSSTIKVSIETHLMAFAAEKSRLNGGKVIEIESIR